MKPVSTTIAALILVILTGFNFCHAAETNSDWVALLKRSTDLFAAKQRDQALLVADSALQAAIAANGDRDSSVAMCWHRISGIASDMSKSNADSLFRQTFAAWDRVANPNQVERAKTLSNYGGWLSNQGRYEESLDTLYECLKIRTKLLAADHVEIARVEHKLGQTFVSAGKPASAIPHLEKAVEIFKLKGKSALAQLSESHHTIGNAYFASHRPEAAVNSFLEAIAVAEEMKDDARKALYLARLASPLTALRQYNSADSACNLALSLLHYPDTSNYTAPDIIALSEALNAQGLNCWQTKDTAKAISCLSESLALKEKWKTHPAAEVQRTKYNLANLYRDTGDYAHAESLYLSVLAERRKNPETAPRDIAYSLYSLALLYARTERYLEAFDSAYSACQIRISQIQTDASYLSESDLVTYSQLIRESANLCLSIAAASKSVNNARAIEIANIMLGTKGFVSDFVFSNQQAALENSGKNATPPTAALVQAALPDNSALIEYFRFGIHHFKDKADSTLLPHAYAALIIPHDKKPRIVQLGDAAIIDPLIKRYREHLSAMADQPHLPTADQNKEYAKLAKSLYRLVLAPVIADVKSQTLVISPDGALNNVSFAALTMPNDKYLVESFPVHYVSAGRDILRTAPPRSQTGSLVAFADPDFDAPPDQRINEPAAASIGTALARPTAKLRSPFSDCVYTRGIKAMRLKRTLAEAEAVCSSWDLLGNATSRRFFGAVASEDNFKSRTLDAAVIYVATHGFLIDSACATQGNSPEAGGWDADDNPLAQSGFLLAGANLQDTLATGSGFEDGIVTAAEVAEMKFAQAPVVVLSACESALGVLQDGEGVYGLRRSFLFAGASTVVSTLWKIEDKSTASMMKSLIADNSEIISARIRTVQLAQINELRQSNRADHPYLWGAFIATGALK